MHACISLPLLAGWPGARCYNGVKNGCGYGCGYGWRKAAGTRARRHAHAVGVQLEHS